MKTETTKTPKTTTRSAKEPAMKKTTEKKTAPKSTSHPIADRLASVPHTERVAILKGLTTSEIFGLHTAVCGEPKPRTPRPVMERRILEALAASTPAPEVDDITAAAGITTAAAIAVGEEDAPVASDAHVDAPGEQPAPMAAAATDDAPVANTDATVGTCDRCGRTDVTLRAEGGLTLHDRPDGGACNFAIEPIAAAIAQALEEQPAEPDVRDMILARARTMTPAAQRSFFESFEKKDLLLLVERATGQKTSGRLSPKGAVERLMATLNPAAPKADKPAKAAKPDAEQPAATATSTRGRAADLPVVGTVLNNVDRHGKVRASCTVVEGGVEHAGTKYTSLSAAAIAASKALGNQTKQTSGPRFWGLLAGAPRAAKAAKGLDLDVIGRAWDRYRERAEAATKVASDEEKAKLHALLNGHTSALTDLAAAVA